MNKYLRYIKELLFLCGNDAEKIPLMAVVFILSSFLDLAGIGLIAPYISIMLEPDRFATPSLLALAGRLGFEESRDGLLMAMGLCLVIVFVLKAIVFYFISRMIYNFSHRKAVDIRATLTRSYQNMDYVDYLKRNSSEYFHSILTLAAVFAESSLQALLRIFSEGIVVIVVFSFLLIKNGLEIVVFAALMFISMAGFDLIFRRRLIQSGKTIDTQMKLMVQGIREAIDGLKEIRVLNKEEFFYNRVVDPATLAADARTSSVTIKAIPRYWLELVLILFVVGLTYYNVAFGKDIVQLASTLAMFGVAAMRLIPSANQIISGFASLSHNRNSIALLYKDVSQLKNQDGPQSARRAQIASKPFETLDLHGITYSYDNARGTALNDISLSIHRGDTIGLMGPSGSGKSTLADLLLGLLVPDSGEIIYNGTKLSPDNIDLWVQQVAYIPQQIFLVDDTLRKNVALGTEDSLIDDEKVREAIEKSNLSELLRSLPAGLNTMLGERGIRLSGGQRQRVAIARAFYYDRDILVMDEATSALDNQTEFEIVEEIRRLRGLKTIIVIAHRLSTLKHCGRICRLESGRIVEQGSYEKLVSV